MILKLAAPVAATLHPVASPTPASGEASALTFGQRDRVEARRPATRSYRLTTRAQHVELGPAPPPERRRRAALRRRRVVACWRLALQLVSPANFELGWRLFLLGPVGRPHLSRAVVAVVPSWVTLLAPLRRAGVVLPFGARLVQRSRVDRRELACRPLAVAATMVPGAALLPAQYRRSPSLVRVPADSAYLLAD